MHPLETHKKPRATTPCLSHIKFRFCTLENRKRIKCEFVIIPCVAQKQYRAIHVMQHFVNFDKKGHIGKVTIFYIISLNLYQFCQIKVEYNKDDIYHAFSVFEVTFSNKCRQEEIRIQKKINNEIRQKKSEYERKRKSN
jgi:hypothetical protein